MQVSASAPPAYDPRLLAAGAAMAENRLAEAEPLLRALLHDDPFEVRAIRMLAELAGRIGRLKDAETLLRRALEIAPWFTAARANLALVLYRTNRPAEALAELGRVAGEDPDNLGHANLQAAAYGRIGAFDEALALYEQVLRDLPDQPRVWMSYGHMLKTVGRQQDGIAAYRRALALEPGLGEAWWSLANLKTVRFADADLAAMRAALDGAAVSAEDRWHLHFALGKALEDRGDAEGAFAHYEQGNALRRARIPYSADETGAAVDAAISAATPALLASAGEGGAMAADPIFVLGMPRAGSTLIEQILASHSLVEGTSELPDIAMLARELDNYPACLATLSPAQRTELGEEYLRRAAIQRHSGRPRFVDKMPNNWLHVPLIRLILPRATIIDARRHPLACGFSNFKQHFARGQGFSYDLTDMGRYYADYVRLMAQIDRAAPGAVHRVIHEALIEDTEGEVRALLAACGLEFEPACLAFHQTERAVRTASSEQVRRPINRDGAEAWQRFAPFLGPLEAALGPVLAAYPGVPAGW
ncbi:MAG: sulfotransferase [Proteobacteria bacterium]|nr:sulfotransferase [Pseudomonadota bacterium]